MSDPSEPALREEDLSWREAGGTVIVLDHRSWMYLRLNDSAASLWNALADGANADGLASALVDRYGIDAGQAAADSEAFLRMLAERQLLKNEA